MNDFANMGIAVSLSGHADSGCTLNLPPIHKK